MFEENSKQLDRLLRGVLQAIQKTENLERSRKEEFAALGDADLLQMCVTDPDFRARYITALRTLGYTVEDPKPKPRPPRKVVMRATKAKGKGPERELLEAFDAAAAELGEEGGEVDSDS